MSVLKNVAGAVVGAAVSQAASNLIKGAGAVSGLASSITSLGGELSKLQSSLNVDPSQLLNKVAGQLPNPLDAGQKGGFFKLPKQSLLDVKADEALVEFTIKELPLKNILENYASVNYIWTLSVLSPFHINFPDETYKKGDLGQIIFQSGGGSPENRVSLTNYASTKFQNNMDHNPQGKFDFYIDNVKIKSVVGMDAMTKNTNAATMTFNVYEPYSLGLFFQSLQVAAAQAGYENWVVMPVLLTLDFKGHYGPDIHNVSSVTKRHFPIKIANINLRVTERGSMYECEAVAWNDEAYSDTISRVKTDINAVGSTVQEMLQSGRFSVQTIVNEQLKEQAKKNKIPTPDRIIILFPTDTSSNRENVGSDDTSSPSGATVTPGANEGNVFTKLGVELGSDGYNYVQKDNVNKIGQASLGFTDRRKVEGIFGKENLIWDDKKQVYVRGSIELKTSEGKAHFKQDSLIPNMIIEVVTSSYYGIQALDPANIDSNGKLPWFRISSQHYIIDTNANVPKTGRMPTVTVYRIVPSKVHHSKFMPAKDNPIPVQKPLKEYNYYYTGKNTDILDFQIKFNTTFYTATVADSGVSNEDVKQKNTQNTAETPSTPVTSSGKSPAPSQGEAGTKLLISADATRTNTSGGGILPQDPGNVVVKQFQNAINKSADMIMVNMKILGDPFYLGDSGFGNYVAQGTSNEDVNKDGAINYDRTQVFIDVNFRNPIDINGNTYDFPQGAAVNMISGLYKVNTLESEFNKGLFTQNLELSRMPNYDDPGGTGATSGENAVDFAPPGQPAVGRGGLLEDPPESDEPVEVQDLP